VAEKYKLKEEIEDAKFEFNLTNLK